jgi:hypothetical protein
MRTALRTLLIEHAPTPLYDKKRNWGNTSGVANGVKWRGQGLKVRPELMYANRNDGRWEHVTITSDALAQTLAVDLRNFRRPAVDRITFEVALVFPFRARYHRQLWESGIKLFDGETRARAVAIVVMTCESTLSFKPSGGLLPDLVVRARVTQAHFTYDGLVFEHVPGVGGEAAEILGKAVLDVLKKWKPSIERQMIDKLEAAVVKAADTKELRVPFGSLFK